MKRSRTITLIGFAAVLTACHDDTDPCLSTVAADTCFRQEQNRDRPCAFARGGSSNATTLLLLSNLNAQNVAISRGGLGSTGRAFGSAAS